MIESSYWKEDLLNYAEKLLSDSIFSTYSEEQQVTFEKDIIISFFMVRKLLESHKFSNQVKSYRASIFRYPCIGKVNSMNFHHLCENYDFQDEKKIKKEIRFLSNQLIHGGATFAYLKTEGKWDGVYTCSDFERAKYIYRIPLSEIVKILKVTGSDYPDRVRYTYDQKKQDYKVETN